MLRAAITRLCCSETMSVALRLGVTSAQNVSASGRPTLCQMHPGGHFAQLPAFRGFKAANVCLKSRSVTKAAAAAPVDQMYDSEDDFDDLEQDMAPGVDLGGQPWCASCKCWCQEQRGGVFCGLWPSKLLVHEHPAAARPPPSAWPSVLLLYHHSPTASDWSSGTSININWHAER